MPGDGETESKPRSLRCIGHSIFSYSRGPPVCQAVLVRRNKMRTVWGEDAGFIPGYEGDPPVAPGGFDRLIYRDTAALLEDRLSRGPLLYVE